MFFPNIKELRERLGLSDRIKIEPVLGLLIEARLRAYKDGRTFFVSDGEVEEKLVSGKEGEVSRIYVGTVKYASYALLCRTIDGSEKMPEVETLFVWQYLNEAELKGKLSLCCGWKNEDDLKGVIDSYLDPVGKELEVAEKQAEAMKHMKEELKVGNSFLWFLEYRGW